MSSADALLHVVNTAVCQDFYNKMFKKGQATDREILLVGRITAVIIGAVAVYIAFNPFEGVLWVNWWAWGGLSTFAPVVVLGLYWKRVTREGAIAGLIGGFLGSAIWFAVGYYKWLHLTFVAFVTAMVLLVAVSLVTPAPPREIQDQVDELANGIQAAAK
jgi:sodium/proline symporter